MPAARRARRARGGEIVGERRRNAFEVNRPLAHFAAAAATTLVLEGMASGIAAAVGWEQGGALHPPAPTWAHLAATAAWVVVLLSPLVAWLERRPARLGPAAVAAGLAAAAVRLALDWGSGAAVALRWAFVDAVGLGLGLLVYDLVYAALQRAHAAPRGAAP